FSQDPQINGSIINLWLAAASDLSLQDQKVIYNQIQQKLLSSEYRQEILQTLNAQRDNPQIAALRDAYNIKAESERIVEDFRSDLTAVLNGSMEDKTAFIKQFNKGGNLNLNNQPTQIIQKEQAAIKELLGKDNLTPSNRVFLQQMDLAYEAKLSENDPKKLLDAEKQFLSNGIRYLTDRLNPPIDSQQTKQLLATAGIFSQMVNTMFPMPAPKWPCASKDEALKTVQFSCIAQFVPRLSLLVREIDKGVEKSNQAHLQHALDEYRSVTEHMMPMLELAQTRIENMPLKVLNRVNSEIISAALIDTYDEQYGITQEMRRRAGGEN
ncbi:MAG: hypothetical protein LBD69_00655, partial [Puniceicoccales bacterium]|nr:hypothetical protein [Puniceicoccales bacterium]